MHLGEEFIMSQETASHDRPLADRLRHDFRPHVVPRFSPSSVLARKGTASGLDDAHQHRRAVQFVDVAVLVENRAS